MIQVNLSNRLTFTIAEQCGHKQLVQVLGDARQDQRPGERVHDERDRRHVGRLRHVHLRGAQRARLHIRQSSPQRQT